MAKSDILENVESGERARLIPIVADSKKEERATSVLLSSFMVVRQFADDILSEVGAKVGVKSRIKCYTEVVFKNKENSKIRPDGLVVITLGKKSWSALIEAKVGNAELTKEQVEAYLDLAREVGADAVVTISNQFATKPTHHPVTVNKTKTRSVELFHLSWLLILSKASVLSQTKSIEDREQSFILQELIRYLGDEKTGLSPMSAMNSSWKDICTHVQNGAAITKTEPATEETVNAWHQLMRYLSLKLSIETGAMAQVSLKRAHIKDADKLIKDTTNQLTEEQCLQGAISVPNTASDIIVLADLKRRVVTFSMKVKAPEDKTRATASINWLVRQFKGENDKDLIIKAIWPNRTTDTQATLHAVKEKPEVLVHEGLKDIPKTFEVMRVVDLGGKFRGQRVFVETVASTLPIFYSEAGQYLSNWTPQPPKAKKEAKPEETEFPTDIEPEPTESPISTKLSENEAQEKEKQIY